MPISRTTTTHRYPSSPAHTSVQTTAGQIILLFDDVRSDILTYRVFCNRNLSLKNIKSYGFDMGYTLAVYNVCGLLWSGFFSLFAVSSNRHLDLRPCMPALSGTGLVVVHDTLPCSLPICCKGYPAEVGLFKFDESFPVRGVFFDNTYGNLLKVCASLDLPVINLTSKSIPGRLLRQHLSCAARA